MQQLFPVIFLLISLHLLHPWHSLNTESLVLTQLKEDIFLTSLLSIKYLILSKWYFSNPFFTFIENYALSLRHSSCCFELDYLRSTDKLPKSFYWHSITSIDSEIVFVSLALWLIPITERLVGRRMHSRKRDLGPHITQRGGPTTEVLE